jgi:hypothetical protein
LAALARLLTRRRTAPAAPAPTDDDPAAALRRKLEEQRGDADEPEVEATEPAEQAVSPDLVDLEERRARVHARAQEALEHMREGSADDDPDGGAVA